MNRYVLTVDIGILADHAEQAVRLITEGFLIKEVAPSAERLTDQKADHCDVQKRQKRMLADLRHRQTADQSADDRAVDRDPAVTDIKERTPVTRIKRNIIHTRTDDRRDDTDDDAVKQLVAVNALSVGIDISIDLSRWIVLIKFELLICKAKIKMVVCRMN